MPCAPLREDPFGWPGLGSGWLRWLVCAALVIISSGAQAQTVGPAQRALPAVVRVGVPVPAVAPVTMAAAAGYGHWDRAGPAGSGRRLHSALAVAVSPLDALTVGADVRAWWDVFPREDESNGYGEPRLSARYVGRWTSALWVGAEADVRWIGGQAPSIELAATSPSMRALAAVEAAPQTWFAANLGFHLDRSAEAITRRSALTLADRRTLNASDANALPWGVGMSHRLSAASELLLELSGEAGIGSRASSFAQSPARISAGVRHRLSEQLALLTVFESSLSRRPRQSRDSHLLPMDPKLSALAALTWSYGSTGASSVPRRQQPTPEPVEPVTPLDPPPTDHAPEPEPEPVDPPPTLDPTAAAQEPLVGTVVDEGGHPLADVEVRLELGGQVSLERTDADGAFRFAGVAEGPAHLTVETPGFDPANAELDLEQSRSVEIVLRPAVPAGQVRGRVLNLAGKPVAATITVTPGNHTVSAHPDGSFEVELVPGKYVIQFQHASYSTQQRRVDIAERGVVIVNIALTR